MKYLKEICDIKELVRCGHLSVEDGREQVVDFIKKSILYSEMKVQYSYLITLIQTSIHVDELVDGIDKYLQRLFTLCEERQAIIDREIRSSHSFITS